MPLNREEIKILKKFEILLNDYIIGKINFEKLPSYIKQYLSCFDDGSFKEKQLIFNEWATMEQIYASMLDNNKKKLNVDEKIDVENSIKKIKDIIQNVILENESEPQDPYSWPYDD